MSESRNLSASVFQRLKNQAQSLGQPFEYVLVHYTIERFLYRLSQSVYRDTFILKGGLAFLTLEARYPRATRDIDFLGHTEASVPNLVAIMSTICQVSVVEDGLTFDAGTVTADVIREQNVYGGIRVKLTAHLGQARIPLQMDIGFGDAVTPEARSVLYPALLDLPAPLLRVYPPEAILAEKFQAIVKLDVVNSRLKDFYDIWYLIGRHSFEGPVIAEALARTFARRQTALPPTGLSDTFITLFAARNAVGWQTSSHRMMLEKPLPELTEVLQRIQAFVSPPLRALTDHVAFTPTWQPEHGWVNENR
ncbi:MAG: nucleotidyl transferase AbiEii/AbiGii toxin family protein [Anaerolineae bacterium]|nr:nucleotidyl transferase AbiEii/AbiGii toxin family protein [Anaerolineae bacterium]